MKTARKLTLLLICLAVLTGTAFARAEETEAKPELLYFYENYCDACHPEVEFIETFHSLTGKHVDEYAYSHYNVRKEKDRALYNETAEAYGIAPEDRYLPMVVVDGKVYIGNSKLESALPMDFLENESTDSLFYYLYSPACESCAAAEAVVDALPETIQVKRGQMEFDSKVIARRVNIYDEPSVAQALFEHYRVPEDDQITPIVLLREDYVSGAEAIEKRLPYMLNAGLAVGTPLIAPAEAAEPTALTVAGTALAGFVAGFNPCALSMLLLFLSILLSGSERAGRYAAVYLISKFVAYVAIGTVFLSVLSAWNPTWLPLAAKILLTVVGGVLIIVNLMDARAAYREQYGDIKNQLPRGLRKFLNEHIKRALRGSGAALLVSVVLLGIVVAASEFLCSGQLYLATLTAGLSSGTAYARQFMLLLIFCAAFILPSVIVSVIVVKGRDMFAASNALLKKMPVIKIATAAVMLGIILAAWFLI